MRFPPPARRGDVINRDHFNALRDLAISLGVTVDPASGIEMEQTDAGLALWINEDDEFPAKLTGHSGNDYAWTKVMATVGGTWANDTSASGTTTKDPAHEANGIAVDVAGSPVVWMTREPHSRRLYFERSTCG